MTINVIYNFPIKQHKKTVNTCKNLSLNVSYKWSMIACRPVSPTFTTPSVGSVPPLGNPCQFVPSTWTKEHTPAVSHTPIRPSPYVPMYPQQPASIASSPSHSDKFLKSGAPNWMTLVGQKCHTGGPGVGAD